MQNAPRGTIAGLLSQVFFFFFVLRMMKREREADRSRQSSPSHNGGFSFAQLFKKKKRKAPKNSIVDLFSASFVTCSRVYLSGDFRRWRTGGRSSRPAREWRALCSYPVCEPTRPLRGRSSRATKRTLRCELPLRNMHPTHDQESQLAFTLKGSEVETGLRPT